MEELNNLREKIDSIDKEIAKLLRERMELAREIGSVKAKNGILVEDKNREAEILSKFDENYEKEVFKKIIEESKKIQS